MDRSKDLKLALQLASIRVSRSVSCFLYPFVSKALMHVARKAPVYAGAGMARLNEQRRRPHR